ncbi:VCBS repeat-containing protein [Bradyrhizobium sp. USDA 3311]
MSFSQWTVIPFPSATPSQQPFFALKIVDDPDNPQELFVATSRGLIVSTDGGQSWDYRGPDVFTPSVLPLPGNPEIVYDVEYPPFGLNAGLYRSTDGGVTFAAVYAGLPPESNSLQYNTLAIDPENPNVLYVPVIHTDGSAPAQLWRSTNSGASWTQLPQSAGSYNFLSVAVDPSNSSHILLGTGDLGLLNSYDGGITWTHANSLPASVIFDLEYDHTVVYAATNGGGYRSVDNGTTWTPIQGSESNQIGSIVIDPQNASIVFANSITSDDIYISIDGGENWNSLGQVPGGARSLAYDPQNNTLFALGNDLANLYALSLSSFNRSPTFDFAHSTLTGTINERPNVTGSVAFDSANGVISFTDQDLSDRPTASVVHQSVTYQDAQGHLFQLSNDLVFNFENAFSLAPELGNTNSGKIDWGLKLPDSAFDFLGAGETLTVMSTVEINDGHGGKFDQDVTVTINGNNDKPVAAPDFASVSQGGTLTIDTNHGALANDADPDIHDISHVTTVNGSALSVGRALAGKYGTLTLNADGSWTYLANKAGSGGTDTFLYSVDDGHGGTAQSSLSILDLASAQVQTTKNAQIVSAAKAIASLIGSEAFWVNLDSSKELYDAIKAVYNLIKDDSSFLQLSNQMDALQGAGVNSEFIASWRSLLTDAEANVLSADLRPIWKVVLDKTVDIAVDYLVDRQLLVGADKPLAESVGKSVVNFVTADLKGELWDQSILIAKEVVGLNADLNGLVNDEIRNGLIDIQYLEQFNVLGTPKIKTAIDQEIALMNRTGDDLVNTSLNPIEVDAGFKIDLVSMVLRAKVDQLRGMDLLAAADIAKAESYAVSLDQAYGLHGNPLVGPLNNHFESFATLISDTYHLAGWHL